MLLALFTMSLLIACGVAWQRYVPEHLTPLAHRRALTDLVFYILLPALVLDVIWQSSLDYNAVYIALLAAIGLASALLFAWLVTRFINCTPTQAGVILLASAFPNATYLGLPVLDQVMGSAARATAIQYDFLACTPILLSFGLLIASYYGERKTDVSPIRALIKVPPLWAVLVAILLNVFAVPQPVFLDKTLSTLAGGVVPLMLIVLGMSIRWQSLHYRFLPLLLPIIFSSLILVPLVVLAMSHVFGLATQLQHEVVIIAAMPTMVFGVVISERYGLDTELYASAVTITTLLSLVTLPLWFHFLSH